MLRLLLRRLLLLVPTILVVVTLVFIMVRVAPGDPAIAILGDYATKDSLEALREKMGFNVPLWLQYLRFLSNIFRGDLGVSMLNNNPVKAQLLYALPYTLELTISSMIVGVLLGLPFGILTALRRNRWADYVGRIVSLAGISIPSFYLGILMIFVFSVKLGLFPVMGISRSGDLLGRLNHLVLPAFTMGLILTSYIMRVSRSTMLNVLKEDYIRTAKAKGLNNVIVVYKHALLNALIPIISVTSIYFIVIIGASVMVEIVFSRPGLGKLMVLAMKQRDYVMLQSIMLVYAALAMMINLATDLIYGLVDPRIKYK